jgi:hypothetical protein
MEPNLELPEFLTRRADGEIVVVGSRVSLFHVMTALAAVYNTIGFALDHREKVEAYMTEYRAELDRQYAAGRKVDLEELRARLARKREVSAT